MGPRAFGLDPEGDKALADYLSLLTPSGLTPLISPPAYARIAAAASGMAPIPRIAVELRLAPDAEQVDIQQCFQRQQGDYDLLARHTAKLARATPLNPSLARLAGFCALLSDRDGPLFASVDEIYLEYDLPIERQALPIPSVFLSLPRSNENLLALIDQGLTLLPPEQPRAAIAEAIAHIRAACRGDAEISHLGVMLGRPAGAVRINVKGVRALDLTPFLRECGWRGRLSDAAELFNWASRADRATLALDVGATVSPRLGVECFFDDQPGDDTRWASMLDDLVGEGLCAPAKARAFQAIPGDMLPPASPTWPESFIVQSMTRDSRDFSAFARRAVHLKVTDDGGGRRDAKAYFGAGHHWVHLGDGDQQIRWRPGLAQPRPRRSTAPAAGTGDATVDAINRGIDFLLQSHQQSGLWRDFCIGGAVSDEWVSAYVAARLASTRVARAVSAAHECWQALAGLDRPSGGWGYSRDYPADADSTAWALRLAHMIGARGGAVERGRSFLERHLCTGGGVTTYAEQDALAARIGLPVDASFAGWRQPHCCVTAAAAPFVHAAATDYLRGNQAAGSWPGYWWTHDAYATALSVSVLGGQPEPGDTDRIANAGRWALNCLDRLQQAANSSAFDLANCLDILRSAGGGDGAFQAAGLLIATQEQDGSWPASAGLRVPNPHAIDPADKATRVVLDQRRNFTTATVVATLARWRHRESEPR